MQNLSLMVPKILVPRWHLNKSAIQKLKVYSVGKKVEGKNVKIQLSMKVCNQYNGRDLDIENHSCGKLKQKQLAVDAKERGHL